MRFLLLVLSFACANAFAQSFPSKAVRIIVPYPPGGGTDVVARTVAPKMQEALGQPVVVENRAGAGGNIGAETVFRADPTATPSSPARRGRLPSTRASTRRSTSTRRSSCR